MLCGNKMSLKGKECFILFTLILGLHAFNSMSYVSKTDLT